jgi:hypothetical protein
MMAPVTILSLAPVELDLKLYAGDGVSFVINATNPTTGAALNLTGTVIAQIRQNRTDAGTPLLAFTIDTSQAATGKLTLSLTGAQTATLGSGSNNPWLGSWDVQWTAAGAQPVTLAQGDVACYPDVSH